jgi:hypothetical protein
LHAHYVPTSYVLLCEWHLPFFNVTNTTDVISTMAEGSAIQHDSTGAVADSGVYETDEQFFPTKSSLTTTEENNEAEKESGVPVAQSNTPDELSGWQPWIQTCACFLIWMNTWFYTTLAHQQFL